MSISLTHLDRILCSHFPDTCTVSVLGVKEALYFGIILATIDHFLKTAAATSQSSLNAKEQEHASLSLSVTVFCTDDWVTGISQHEREEDL